MVFSRVYLVYFSPFLRNRIVCCDKNNIKAKLIDGYADTTQHNSNNQLYCKFELKEAGIAKQYR